MTNFDQYAAVPGTKFEDLMPDFFLDDFLEENQKTLQRTGDKAAGLKEATQSMRSMTAQLKEQSKSKNAKSSIW